VRAWRNQLLLVGMLGINVEPLMMLMKVSRYNTNEQRREGSSRRDTPSIHQGHKWHPSQGHLLGLECMRSSFGPVHHLPNGSTTSTTCDGPKGCRSPRDRTEFQEIVTAAALFASSSHTSLTTQQHRPDSILSRVNGCGGVSVSCGTGSVITGSDVLR
jgi:hypothetical protein